MAGANRCDHRDGMREPEHSRVAHHLLNPHHIRRRGDRSRYRQGHLHLLERSLPARSRSEATSHPRLDQQPARCASQGQMPRCPGDLPFRARAHSCRDLDAQHRLNDRGAGRPSSRPEYADGGERCGLISNQFGAGGTLTLIAPFNVATGQVSYRFGSARAVAEVS